jgi:glycosyltransferase involved in cell wall biosynthesis
MIGQEFNIPKEGFQMEDRAAIDKTMAIANYFPDFFSVLLPELGRPHYLRKCIDSIHEHADMPIEVIVHDDGSGEENQKEIMSMRDKISTIVLNNGHNTGLARSFNRCRAMASSPYLLGFNTDTYVTSSFLKKMKTALDLPYVGIVNPVPEISDDGPGVYVASDGTRIELCSRMGNCHTFGMRAEVWDELNVWNENVQTTSSDVGCMGRLFGAGYFSVRVEGTIYNEMWLNDGKINTGETNTEYISSADFTRNDINVPPIFKLPEDQPTHTKLCTNRWSDIYSSINNPLRRNPNFASWHNTNFIIQESGKLFKNGSILDIDWDFAETYGHARWKDRIISDFNLKGV